VNLDGYLDRWSTLHGGYDPRTSAWARTWLRLTFGLASPLARAGVSPHLPTGAGLLAAGLVPVAVYAGYPLLGVPLVALSALFDSLDGAVAVLADRVTGFGYVLDSAADRVAEALLLSALWLAGATGWLCVLAGAAMWLHEYVRARAAGAGLAELGAVTIGERPVRLIVLAVGLAPGAPEAGAALAAVVALGGLVHLLVVVHRELTPQPPGARGRRGLTPGRSAPR
jgi:CDP-diacylglycerol--glycerol-3-phosphate 3-phosphatidyltransferase